MPHKSFSRTPERRTPITFDFEGTKFTAKPRCLMDSIMRLVEENDAQGFTYSATRWVIGQIVPEQQDDFVDLLGTEIDQEVILGIHRFLMESYANAEDDTEEGSRPMVPSAG